MALLLMGKKPQKRSVSSPLDSARVRPVAINWGTNQPMMNEKTFSRGSRMLQAAKSALTPQRKPVSSVSSWLATQRREERMDCDDESDIHVVKDIPKTPKSHQITASNSYSNDVAFRKRLSEKENRPRPVEQQRTTHLQDCTNTNENNSSDNKPITMNKSPPTSRPAGTSNTLLLSVARETSLSCANSVPTPEVVPPASRNTLGTNNSARRLGCNTDELKKLQDFAVLEIVDIPSAESNSKPGEIDQLPSKANKRPCVSEPLLSKNASSFYGRTVPVAKKLCVRGDMRYAYLGLRNIGLSCYMNAALQLLLSVPKFSELLEVIGSKRATEVSPSNDVVSCLLEIIKCRQMKCRVLDKCLSKLLTSAGKQFRLYQQADSHEFLLAILTHVKSLYPKSGAPTLPNTIFDFMKRETSICHRCDWSSSSSSTNSCVILSVDDCLAGSERSVYHGIMNTMRRRSIPCLSCSAVAENGTIPEGYSASVVCEWDSLPECLLINLSRTERRDHLTHKSNAEVLVQRLLILGGAGPFSNLAATPYYLAAFVLHKGTSSESGHYVSWVLDGEQWLSCDDDSVTLADLEASSVSQEGCVFLYKRTDC